VSFERERILDGTYNYRVNDGNIINGREVYVRALKLVTDDCGRGGDPRGIPVGVMEILKFVPWM
jgi:hypothetical protein